MTLVSLSAVLFLAMSAMAQDKVPLQTIDHPLDSGETKCLPYFGSTTFKGATAEQIIFEYKGSDGHMKHDTIPKSRTAVHVADLKTPTYEKTTKDFQEGAIFRMSNAEYEKSKACLPEATPEPEQKP